MYSLPLRKIVNVILNCSVAEGGWNIVNMLFCWCNLTCNDWYTSAWQLKISWLQMVAIPSPSALLTRPLLECCTDVITKHECDNATIITKGSAQMEKSVTRLFLVHDQFHFLTEKSLLTKFTSTLSSLLKRWWCFPNIYCGLPMNSWKCTGVYSGL